MEFSTSPLPPTHGYTYHPHAILTLTSHESVSHSRRASQSGQRRPSFGAPTGTDGEQGSGLRKVVSRRKSMSAQEAKEAMLRDPNDPTPATPAAAPAALARTKSREVKESKNGKFEANVDVVVTSTHLILLLPPNSHLTPVPTDSHSLSSKIKSLFTGGSHAPAAAAEGTTGELDMNYPGYINGQATTHVLIPLGAVREEGVKVMDEKGEVGVYVPVTDFFSSLVHPMLDDLGRDHNDSWARSGSVQFTFPKTWIGAKAEAEVLHHAITAGIENRKSGGKMDRRLSFGAASAGKA